MNIKGKLKSSIALCSSMVLVIALALSCQQKPIEPAGSKIITTIYPLYDITRNLAGDSIEVVYIIQPGESPHTFELTPERAKNLMGAQLAIKVGLGLDDWLDDTITGLGMETNVQQINSHIDLIAEDGYVNPHIWLSVSNSKIITKNIVNLLVQNYPQFEEEIKINEQNYLKELQELEEQGTKSAKDFKKKEFIAFHNAWAYLARDLDIAQIASIEPFPGKEPTPDYLMELYEIVKEHNIDTIFIEPQLSTDVVNYLAEDLQLQVIILDPLGGMEERDSYIQLINYNLDQLGRGLK